MSGLNKNDFKDEGEMEGTMLDLIKDSEEELGYKSEYRGHANPKLRKWLYVHNKGHAQTTGSKNSGTVESSSSLGAKHLGDLLGADKGCVVDIKAESAEIKALRELMLQLKKGKKLLDKHLSEGLDLGGQLSCKNALADEEVSKLTNAVIGFLGDIRRFVGEHDRSSVSVDEAPDLLGRGQKLWAMMDAHIDGMKHVIKKYKPLVN